MPIHGGEKILNAFAGVSINEKYVLLREFAIPNEEWARKADYIEFLYTDEAEHQEEIQRIRDNHCRRLGR